ncbi:MAG: phosphatidate cytidylyltransferase [Clostridiales bacterium]|nr:phosphatidate cytidylyltransferase [Clostridiales bacterium]
MNKKALLNRVLVGIAIFVVIIGMILLNIYFPNYINDEPIIFISGRAITSVIFYALILLSVIEMRRALGKDKIPDSFSWLLWMYGIGAGPAYSLFGYTGIIFFSLIVFICAVVTALFINRADSLMYIGFMLIYPGLLMASLLFLNRAAATNIDVNNVELRKFLESDIWIFLSKSRQSYLLPLNAIALAFVFAVSTFTDMFAYFVGSKFGKHKLSPEISPNKSVEGAIGGIIGGVLGSLVVYFFFDFPYFLPFGEQFGLTFSGLGLPSWQIVFTYVLIGVLGSIATQIGDLLASLVKRYCGIKDYSRVLGEHGGIMDRFDGIMLNSVLVSFIFMFIF